MSLKDDVKDQLALELTWQRKVDIDAGAIEEFTFLKGPHVRHDFVPLESAGSRAIFRSTPQNLRTPQ
jgi:hypothetical protein